MGKLFNAVCATQRTPERTVGSCAGRQYLCDKKVYFNHKSVQRIGPLSVFCSSTDSLEDSYLNSIV